MKRADIEKILEGWKKEDLTHEEAEKISNAFSKFNDQLSNGVIPDDVTLDDLPPFDDKQMIEGEKFYKRSVEEKEGFIAGQDMALLGRMLLELKYAAFLQYKMEDGFITYCENIKKRALASGDKARFKEAEKELKKMLKNKGKFFKR